MLFRNEKMIKPCKFPANISHTHIHPLSSKDALFPTMRNIPICWAFVFRYSNRALVYIKMNRFKEAIKDCDNILDIWEWMEDKRPFKGISTIPVQCWTSSSISIRCGNI